VILSVRRTKAATPFNKSTRRLSLTLALTEVRFPRKFRPREDFSHMAEKFDRVGEIYRAEIGFGNFTSRVKFLLMPVRRG